MTLFVRAFLDGVGAVRRSKRLLVLSALTTGLLALPLAVWGGCRVDAAAARRPDATEIARAMDADFFADVRYANPAFDADATALVVAALLMLFVLRPLIWGGYAGIAAASRRIRFSKFVREGGAVYWKFLRLSMVGLLALWALSLALKPAATALSEFADDAVSGDLARTRVRAGQAVLVGVLLLVPLVLDYARVGIRMHRRPGVLAELGRSALFVARHPFRTVGFFLLSLALEVAVCWPLIVLVRLADGGYVATSYVVLVLGQAMIALRESARLFHLAGAWTIRAAEDRSAAPDEAAGAPGGDLLEERLPWHAR